MSEAQDPIRLEIVSHALVAAAEEMNVTIWRTSRSTTVRELLDYSTAVFDRDGRNLAQAARMPVHLNSMEPCLEEIKTRHIPLDDWAEGDVIITNDPYSGGQHLPDFLCFKPVFHQGRRIAITGVLTHHVDVGGGAAGGYNARATEVFHEGVRVPPVRLVTAGKLNQELLATILCNVREPEIFRSDLLSEVSALEVGARSIRALADKYGGPTFEAVGQAILDGSEAGMRAAIAAIPDGSYAAEDWIDGDGLSPETLRIVVRVTVAGDRLAVDLSGTAPQAAGPVNATFALTKSAVYYAIIAATGAPVAANSGCYRPIDVAAPVGSLVNAAFPAPVSMRMLTGHKIVTATLRALAGVLPERIPAAYYGVTFNHAIGIIHADGRRQVYFDSELGGWGGHPEQDGADGLSAGFHNQQNTPIEMIESLYPLTFTRYGLLPDSGGAGRHRGGLGIVREWRFDGHRGLLNASFDAFRSRPYGLDGGAQGSAGRLSVTRDRVMTELPPKVIGHELAAGDVVRMETPGGGGHGDPSRRDPTALAADLAGGYVTAGHANISTSNG